MFRVKDRLTL